MISFDEGFVALILINMGIAQLFYLVGVFYRIVTLNHQEIGYFKVYFPILLPSFYFCLEGNSNA